MVRTCKRFNGELETVDAVLVKSVLVVLSVPKPITFRSPMHVRTVNLKITHRQFQGVLLEINRDPWLPKMALFNAF